MTAATIKRPLSFFNFDGTADGASLQAQAGPKEHSKWLRGFAGGSATGTAQIENPRQKILSLQLDCSAPNWDGAAARPVSIHAASVAEKLLLTLPSYLPIPEIYAEASGGIVFEWHRRTNYRFVLTVYKSGIIEFAGLLGLDTEVYGAARMGSDLPIVIRDHLRQLFTN